MDTRRNDHSTGLLLLSRLLLHVCFSTTLDKEARFLGGFKYVTFHTVADAQCYCNTFSRRWLWVMLHSILFGTSPKLKSFIIQTCQVLGSHHETTLASENVDGPPILVVPYKIPPVIVTTIDNATFPERGLLPRRKNFMVGWTQATLTASPSRGPFEARTCRRRSRNIQWQVQNPRPRIRHCKSLGWRHRLLQSTSQQSWGCLDR